MRITIRSVSGFIYAVVLMVFLSFPTTVRPNEATTNEQAVVDELLKKILDHGFIISMPRLEEVKSQVEIHDEQAIFNLPVTLKVTDAARESLDAATKRLGGQTMEAFFEADYGIVSWEAHAMRVSQNPRTLEYVQRRIGSMAFRLRLLRDDQQGYECQTKDVWKLPITPVRQLFAYGGRATIQGLGISPQFDMRDYGFIAARKQPTSFIYRGTIPADEFTRIVNIDGRMVDGKNTGTDSDCRKTSGS